MIIIRTNHDEGTHYMFVACDNLICQAKKKGFKVISIEGNDINFNNLKKRVEKLKPKFIFFNGHGSSSSIYDNEDAKLVTIKESNVFQNTITYARACDCLKKLGKSAVKEGCTAFIGYNKLFWIPKLDGYMSRPMKDPIAKPVMDSSNVIVKQLINKKTVKEAMKKSQELTTKYIMELIYSNDPYKSATLAALINNSSALGFFGNNSAKLN